MTEGWRIAYVMSHFPGLSETFILREMCEVEQHGWQLELYPLIFQHEAVLHDEAMGWMDRAHRTNILNIFAANFGMLFSWPFLFFSLLMKVIVGNLRSPKFLIRALVVYPKAVWMERQIPLKKVAHFHAHYATHPALAACVIHQITGISYSVTVHAHDDIFVDKSMLGVKLRDAIKIVVISQYNREYLTKRLGAWIGEKIVVIHCGVVPGLYTNKAVSAPSIDGEFNILSIGSHPYKGFHYLLDACSLLNRQGFSFHCRIVGDGELNESLLNKIQDQNLHDCVELLGLKTRTDVANLLRNSDCYVQSSVATASGKMERIPVALMEAMASELPVVATNISGIPELVLPQAGYLVSPDDLQALADAIFQIYSNTVEAGFYPEAGRNLVAIEYSISVNVALLSDLFESFIED